MAQTRTNTLIAEPVERMRPLPRERRRQRITAELSDRVVALYSSGMSTREVAAEAGLSKTAVLRILTSAEVVRRPRGGHNHPVLD